MDRVTLMEVIDIGLTMDETYLVRQMGSFYYKLGIRKLTSPCE